jgi:hypothetical protein
MKYSIIFFATLISACSTPPGAVITDSKTDSGTIHELVAEVAAPDAASDGNGEILEPLDIWFFDSGPDAPFVECAPGDGCFLDPCTDNQQCQSAWCVEHMGDGVCTQQCTEECPPGWSCKSVGAGGPDLTYVCVSSHANLCRPCSSGADCKGIGGTEDLCLDYGDEGSFCGGGCAVNEDCPWGFSCLTTVTVDGISTLQCVADAGVCPCTAKSVALTLSTPCEVANEFGTCGGKRFCTDEGLSDCDAMTPQAEVCNGVDDDCDGSIDEPEEAEGKLLLPCDDANPCTDDICNGEEGCSYTNLTEGECLDGDACTIGDHCEEGVCLGAPIDCDDDNPCTDDVCDGLGGCDFLANSAKCDDEDPCTVADSCEESVCVGFAVECACNVDADCDKFDDGDPCTGTLLCNLDSLPYQCQVDPATVVQCEPPEGPHAFCLASICDPDAGKCEVIADHGGLACNDHDACTIGESCQEGSCAGGVPANCGDNNPCTDDSCSGADGCSHTPNDDPCQDGDACTLGDFCADGGCQAGELADCDDGNPCTDDDCSANFGCTHVANDAGCDDGNACTTGDHCESGACVSSAALDCDDKNPCTDDSCAPDGGCEHAHNSAPCSDLNACTLNDGCAGGLCVPGASLACNDGNLCSDDSCDQQLGCLYEANDLPCDDDNACTLDDKCKAGKCQSALSLGCDDDNLCTTDSCSPDQGCVHMLNSAPCDDGNLCTTKDQCQLGECVGSQPPLCNDNNPCTDDGCAPESGCTFAPNQAGCDDSNACTTGDTCTNGWCQGTTLVCNDDNLCTDDSCDSQDGCQATPNNAPCDDADACTSGDVCADSKCAGLGVVNCDDGEPCTDDSCVADTGCVHENNTKDCDDSNACTVVDVCADGACVGAGVPDCDDDKKCTSDTCDTLQGCLHTPITPCCGNGVKEGGEACDDGNEIDGDGCNTDCTAPPVKDWRIGTWAGVPVYGVKNCASGDWYCQAEDACEQATGADCVWQAYNCSSYPNENGSFYPTSNPLGRSPATNGSSDLNWTVTSGCTTNGGCDHGNAGLYGNLCCCACNTINQQWNEGNNFCGVGIWEPY